MSSHDNEHPNLPEGWTAAAPTPDDVPELTELVASIQRLGKGKATIDEESVHASAVGQGAWTRRQLVIRDADGKVAAWPVVHDRAAGRTMIDLDVRPDLGDVDDLARELMKWIESEARNVTVLRGLTETHLDASPYSNDVRLKRWLTEHGYERVRLWLQMSRPVTPDEADLEPVPGVRVRPVEQHSSGVPVAEDIQAVHVLIEESFQDHFNNHRESFPEFVQRQREDPGHRWNHWWLADIQEGDQWVPAGAVVSTFLDDGPDGPHGTYISYIGVGHHARGRGAGKALLREVIAEAARNGRNRVDLEVDDDSPTNADKVYKKLGWVTKYETESWHKPLTADPRPIPSMVAPDRQMLTQWLDYYRATLEMKLDGLTPLQANSPSVPPSELTLAGLVRHMAFVEGYWFGHIGAGEDFPDLFDETAVDGGTEGGLLGGTPETFETDIAQYHKMCAASNDVASKIDDLDAPLPGQRGSEDVSLRYVYVHMIEEYARHCGHADLIREAIDGTTGD